MKGFSRVLSYRARLCITAGSAFPGLADLLHGYDELDAEEKGKRMKELRKGFNLELSRM